MAMPRLKLRRGIALKFVKIILGCYVVVVVVTTALPY